MHLSSLAVSRFVAGLVATFVLVCLLAAGALTPLSSSQAEELSKSFDELASSLAQSPAGIFVNNLTASLLMMVPALGMALAAFIVYNTGLVIAAISSVHNIPAGFSLLIPFLTLYGFVEMLAYGFAVSESFYLASAIVKKRFGTELRVLPYVIALVVGLLALAAFIEWALIAFFQRFLPS
ncbi:MAG: stage II sporulation protein M [Candidatus Caldarchaeum sp.]